MADVLTVTADGPVRVVTLNRPAAYNAALTHHSLHIVQHLMFMAVAVMMWWHMRRRTTG